MFAPEVAIHLKYYVYRLIDPRNGQTFYVGKGVDNRVFSHARGEMEASGDRLSSKMQIIRDIRLAGFDVAHVIHRHGMDEQTAFEVEAALIDAYPETTNIVSGHYCDERGVMHSQQIIEQYQAEEIIFHHKVLMINIGQTATEYNDIYEAVHYAWVIDPKRASKAQYILAMRQGLVIGVFVAEKWLNANQENFPNRTPVAGRWGFIGHPAPDDVALLYMRKRLPDKMKKKGSSNPVRYEL